MPAWQAFLLTTSSNWRAEIKYGLGLHLEEIAPEFQVKFFQVLTTPTETNIETESMN
jgi:hypothetical protein